MLANLWMTLLGVLMLTQSAHAQASGILKVNANVDQAIVHVGSELMGPAPLTREIAPGSYMVRITADGFDPYVRQITVSSGQTATVGAKLSIGGGTADFMADPEGATVEINGKDTGLRTPTRLSALSEGRYRYRLLKVGYEPVEGDFEIKNFNNPLISATLLSSSGRFEVTSEPAGAIVYVDGQERGETPLVLQGVNPGLHQVGVRMNGYALLVRQVDTSDGSKGSVNARLKKDGGKLTVKTGDAQATVMLDGVPIGTGKTVSVKATRGSYIVDVQAPGMAPATGSAKVPVKGGVLYKADLEAGQSVLAQSTPLTQRWTFWTGVGLGVAAVGTGSAVAVAATRPDPLPSGDVALTLP
ncbi:MAG: hypothetical protein ACI9VR_004077 [Cognaticolwellia sp.]|jgi:hypothetical protein